MDQVYIFASIALVAGVVIGALVVVCLGISRDDRPGGFPAATDDRMARAAPSGNPCRHPQAGVGRRDQPPTIAAA